MKAEQLTLLPQLKFGGTLGDLANNQNAVMGIRDPYSNKIYGELPYDQLAKQFKATQRQIQNKLSTRSFGLSGNSLDQRVSKGLGDIANNRTAPTMRETLTSALASLFLPNKEDYVYQDKMMQSYQQYGNEWDSYFKGSYQNPRITEEQKNKAAKGMQEFNTATNAARTNSAGSEGLTISPKRTVGTGISSSTFNPFGSLETGIGI